MSTDTAQPFIAVREPAPGITTIRTVGSNRVAESRMTFGVWLGYDLIALIFLAIIARYIRRTFKQARKAQEKKNRWFARCWSSC